MLKQKRTQMKNERKEQPRQTSQQRFISLFN